MTDYTLTSSKNLPDKAREELTRQAIKAGCTAIGDMVAQIVDDPTNKGRIYQFTLTAS